MSCNRRSTSTFALIPTFVNNYGAAQPRVVCTSSQERSKFQFWMASKAFKKIQHTNLYFTYKCILVIIKKLKKKWRHMLPSYKIPSACWKMVLVCKARRKRVNFFKMSLVLPRSWKFSLGAHGWGYGVSILWVTKQRPPRLHAVAVSPLTHVDDGFLPKNSLRQSA